MLVSTKPKNKGEEAAVLRARQLTDFKWTPLRDVPTYDTQKGNGVLPAGTEVTGFPYASTERTDRFIAENISFESFICAVRNPHSKLYQPGHAAYNASNFGIVCNGFVRYAFGIKERVTTENWYSVAGMREVKPKGEYTVDEMRLCDVLYAYGEGRNHVSLITDLLLDGNGEVKMVEVSEAIRPACVRRLFSPEDFYEKFKLFSLCRYGFLDSVPALDENTDKIIREGLTDKHSLKIAVDNGNRSNYPAGDEILISVFSDKADTVMLYKNGELIEEIKTFGRAFFPRVLGRGYYTAVLKEGGEAAQFAVTCPEISFEAKDGFITVKADALDEKSKLLYMDFRKNGKWFAILKKYETLTDEERKSKIIRRAIPEGAECFKVYFENEYGVWTHDPIRFV